MKRILALLMAVLTLLSLTLVFASCDNAATTDDTEKPSTSGEGEEKTVVVGYTIYEPMNYKDESGKLVGFDTELAEAVFAKLGYKVKQVYIVVIDTDVANIVGNGHIVSP